MATKLGSETVTSGIRVRVVPTYLPMNSDPDADHFAFGYQIRISNESEREVKLLSRHWIIVDADGTRNEVVGSGVVGEQPDLAPGTSFEYTSMCPLATPWGTMEGSYTMRTGDGERFEVAIGRFYLAAHENATGVQATSSPA